MLDGEKPSGCQYCWNVESLGEDYISDRKKALFLYINQTQKELMRLVNRWDYNVNLNT